MQIGVIGLGRMGGNIVRRLREAGHSSVVYDANPAPGAALAKEGATAVASLSIAGRNAGKRRAPSGSCCPPARSPKTRSRQLAGLMKPGDVDHRRRQHQLQGRRAPRPRAAAQGHPLSRRRHLGRRLGPGARLLPDDRRRRRDGDASRSDLLRPGAGHRRHRAHRQAARRSIRAPSAATSTPARPAPAIS